MIDNENKKWMIHVEEFFVGKAIEIFQWLPAILKNKQVLFWFW
jgi:hypothetical protein